MAQKTLLALGGSRLLMPVIDATHRMGHRVVTADYLPDNYAHAFADDYRNISIVDEERVLQTAHDINADGIVSFAADPGVISAAYAAEHLGLTFPTSDEATRILQSKDMFRSFLAGNGFDHPEAHVFTSVAEARKHKSDMPYPVIVKPVDAAGSKGVERVNSPADLSAAVEKALAFSLRGTCIAESFVEMVGRQIVAEGFTIDGEFTAIAYMDHVFDEQGSNPYAPTGHIFPSQAPSESLALLTHELQRLASLLNFRSGIYNIEARVAPSGRPVIMEVSPRGGGNHLAEFVRVASEVDLVRATVQAALGLKIDPLTAPTVDGTWLQQVLFSRHNGVFRGFHIEPDYYQRHVREVSCWVSEGDEVHSFDHASYAFGVARLQFKRPDDMQVATSWPNQHFRPLVDRTVGT